MRRNFDEDISRSDAEAISGALATIHGLLQSIETGGPECSQALNQAEASFKNEGPISAKREVFRAFHLGFEQKNNLPPSSTLPEWSQNPGLKLAYETGGDVADLNYRCRGRRRLRRKRNGPFDAPKVREAFQQAIQAVKISGETMSGNR